MTSLTPEQLARATAALERWYANPGGIGYRAPGVTWTPEDYQSMHAALEAPTVEAALMVFGAVPGTWLTTAAQDAENRDLMDELRRPPC